ncbi:MAG: hypothetical protein NC191_06275 [Muribaculaceae bacterium]|nr:hypothetical protein [Muribaculaceae bacterium]
MTNIQSRNISFGSRFVPTEPLRKMFYDTVNHSNCYSKQEKREVINAIQALLNDGKDDVIEILGRRYDKEVVVNVNGKKGASSDMLGQYFLALGKSVANSICELAKKRNKNIDLQKKLNFEDPISQNLKKKLINFVNKERNSLQDISKYARKIHSESDRLINEGLTNKLDKIATQLFGEYRSHKPFIDFD